MRHIFSQSVAMTFCAVCALFVLAHSRDVMSASPSDSKLSRSETTLIDPGLSATDFTVATGTWLSKAPMPTPRHSAAAAEVDGIIYVIGGADYAIPDSPERRLQTNEAYDPVTDSWVTRAPMPTRRMEHVAVAVDGIIYAIGGDTAPYTFSAENEAYDPVADTWTVKAPMPMPRTTFAAAAVDGVIYAIGGMYPQANMLDVNEAYDPASDSWTTKATMPTARQSARATAVDGLIYVLGGSDTPTCCVDANEVYDPATDSWEPRAPMPSARNLFALSEVRGTLYAIGGVEKVSQTWVSTNEAYHLDSNTWSASIDMPAARANLAWAKVNDSIFVLGGFGPDRMSLATNEAFVPAAATVKIAIDVKPGNKQNVINPGGKGGIWVAILSDTDTESPLDPASQIDIPTVEFGTGAAKSIRYKVKDVNKDGLGDLLLRFNIADTGIACGDTEATLTGQTYEGKTITGTDSIRTVGCKAKCKHNENHHEHKAHDKKPEKERHNGKGKKDKKK